MSTIDRNKEEEQLDKVELGVTYSFVEIIILLLYFGIIELFLNHFTTYGLYSFIEGLNDDDFGDLIPDKKELMKMLKDLKSILCELKLLTDSNNRHINDYNQLLARSNYLLDTISNLQINKNEEVKKIEKTLNNNIKRF